MSVSSEVLPNTELDGRVTRFLYHEAELLDNFRFADWLVQLIDRAVRELEKNGADELDNIKMVQAARDAQ